ncbi:anti-sigma factor domain-containing protein [Streptomyces sp. WAC08241]|uniref:anti-sigma factor n=1 Tax=Streptomyces sp. WAC08241 TaxID=2487421 RepID=UPI000F784C2C|nr:anti-sigma factor [Streptomyces sp. WAC08241]RSS38408.1 anti-sigma factor [Streptomyces sp. WAC08241]
MTTTDELHTLTGAYVLDALETDEEREAFERHLAQCAPCAHEVRELSETTARLGLAVAAPIDPALRAEVLRRIVDVRQFPPPTRPVGRSPGGLGGLRRLPRWALAASVAGLVALGGVAGWQYERAEDADRRAAVAEERAEAVAAVLAAPDARVSTARLADGAVGTLVHSPSQDRAVFAAAGMPAPPPGKVYQLWYDDSGTMRPAGLMTPGAATSAVLLEGPANRSAGIGITVEPAGGSPRPTSDPVATMAMPAA